MKEIEEIEAENAFEQKNINSKKKNWEKWLEDNTGAFYYTFESKITIQRALLKNS